MAECLFDYPHAAVWCPACYAEQQQGHVLTEMRRANDLKQQELLLRDQRSEDDWRPAPKPVRYVPAPVKPPEQPKQTRRGGMNVEPQ